MSRLIRIRMQTSTCQTSNGLSRDKKRLNHIQLSCHTHLTSLGAHYKFQLRQQQSHESKNVRFSCPSLVTLSVTNLSYPRPTLGPQPFLILWTRCICNWQRRHCLFLFFWTSGPLPSSVQTVAISSLAHVGHERMQHLLSATVPPRPWHPATLCSLHENRVSLESRKPFTGGDHKMGF